MANAYASNWWAIALRGSVAILFGVLALALPGLALLTLVFLFAVYAFVDGVFAILSSARGEAGERNWWLALGGVAGIVVGLLTVFWPGLTALALVICIASWALVTGAFEIAGAIRLRNEISNEWLLIFDGALSVLFGLLLFVAPGAGALALIWIIAAYAIVSGVALLLLAFRLRSRHVGGEARAFGA